MAKRVPILAHFVRRWRIRNLLYADVATVLTPGTIKPAPRKVLFATSLGGEAIAGKIEGALAAAMSLRGAESHFLLCDRALPACQMCIHQDDAVAAAAFAKQGPQAYRHCEVCYPGPADLFAASGATVHRFSRWLTADDIARAGKIAAETAIDDISAYREGTVPIGEHAQAGALRYFSRAKLSGEPLAEPVLRRYFEAALLTSYSLRRLFAAEKFECVVLHHGIYVPQGLIAEVAREAGIRRVVWNVAYRKQRFTFSHDDTYHHTLISEPASHWESMRWTPEIERALSDYLASRRTGSKDWINFAVEREGPERAMLLSKLDLDPGKPVILLLTNVLWDAQLHYPANAFPDMLSWIFDSIRAFAARPDLQLVVRVHPAEVTGYIRSRQLVTDELAQKFPQLPANVRVVGPQDSISTYALFDVCNAALIYGTKTGVELTAAGIPTVVAGEAWIRGKGLTFDANTPEQYHEILSRLPFLGGRDAATTARARKYAYHFFFRRMIPLAFVEATQGWPPYRIASNAKLAPNADPGLDVVCNGILSGTPFIYPAEDFTAMDVGP